MIDGLGLAVVIDANVSRKVGRDINIRITSGRDRKHFMLAIICTAHLAMSSLFAHTPSGNIATETTAVTVSGNIATETFNCCHGPLVRGGTTWHSLGILLVLYTFVV